MTISRLIVRRAVRPRKTKTTAEKYHDHLESFIRFLVRSFPVGHALHIELTNGAEAPYDASELFQLTPAHVVSFLNSRAYKNPFPTEEEKDHPIHARSSGLEFNKKALSYFMPNQGKQWCNEGGTGNPTKSDAVNKMIQRVKLAECRGNGKKSNAKRDMKRNEFLETNRSLQRNLTGVDR